MKILTTSILKAKMRQLRNLRTNHDDFNKTNINPPLLSRACA